MSCTPSLPGLYAGMRISSTETFSSCVPIHRARSVVHMRPTFYRGRTTQQLEKKLAGNGVPLRRKQAHDALQDGALLARNVLAKPRERDHGAMRSRRAVLTGFTEAFPSFAKPSHFSAYCTTVSRLAQALELAPAPAIVIVVAPPLVREPLTPSVHTSS
jgi:hypothetical protein